MTAALPNIETVLLHALADKGQQYVFGAKGDPLAPIDTTGIDCSGLIKRSCDRSDVRFPVCPDGSWNQWALIVQHGRVLPVDQALRTRGACLFIGPNGGEHVAWSLGDGTTIEARGRAWGVGCWAAAGRFQLAGLLPGIDYSPRPAYTEDDFMQTNVIIIEEAARLPQFGGYGPAVPDLGGQPLPQIKTADVVSWQALADAPPKATTADGLFYLEGPGEYLVVTHT